jgi:hypothetical protein
MLAMLKLLFAPFRFVRRAWLVFRNQILLRPVDMFSLYFAAFWAMGLLPGPEAKALVLQYMDSALPLQWWGVMAALVAISHSVSFHLHPRGIVRWPRQNALLLAAGFWTAVAFLFWASGVSVTGKGIYTTTALFVWVWGTSVPSDD